MNQYHRLRKKQLKELAALTTSIVKNLVEFEVGPIPIDAMVTELEELLEEWIDEVDSERELAWILENDGFALVRDQKNITIGEDI